MIRYSHQKILFHSIVDNNSRNVSVLPERAYALFRKYKMDVAPISSLGICKSYDELCDSMYCGFRDTSLPSLAQEHEGAIVSFVKRDSKSGDTNTDRVLSLAIIENFEYKILR